MEQKRAGGAHPQYDGIISLTARGVGFFTLPETDEDIRIEREFLNTALHNDYVSIRLRPEIVRERRTGEVVRIVTRAKTEFVGTISSEGSRHFVVPQDKRMYTNIELSPQEARKAAVGEKALVEITGWKNPLAEPSGVIREVIGKKGVHETEMRALALDRGIDLSFPPRVLAEAEEARKNHQATLETEAAKRRDMRGVAVFTIDPKTAKDFDDALSVEPLTDGVVRIGIHIADVSAFVKKGTVLDEEAAKRSNSIYLVDRTIPMLPDALSNDICSLNPDQDRLTFSAIVDMTKDGHITHRWFGKTIIHSRKRFTYEEAQEVLDAGTGIFHSELTTLNAIAKKLRTKREKEGALSFETEEVQFELDENGVPISIHPKVRTDSHKLVEEFMILANAAVARYMAGHDEHVKQTFIYRVHPLPDTDKIKELVNLLHALGYKVPPHRKQYTAKDIGELLKKVAGESHEELVNMVALQAMEKAVYSTKNVGHFGLSLKHYTHFTSPIRRYADLAVHRLLFRYVSGEKIPLHELKEYEALSRYATEREIAATDAERESVKFKQSEYMARHIGATFKGIVSGISEKGIFVEESGTKTSGMIPVRKMTDDYYMFDKKTYSLIGRRRKKRFTLGDPITIKVASVDVEKRFIDYEIA